MSKKILFSIIAVVFTLLIVIFFVWHRGYERKEGNEKTIGTQQEAPSTKGSGAYVPTEKEIIQVLFPQGGENLEVSKTYKIQWENYIGDEPLTIALQVKTSEGKTYTKSIAEAVSALSSGAYDWTITSEPMDSKYKIEIYPESDRAIVGKSQDFFSIVGDRLIIVESPLPLDEVNGSFRITGKARQIFSEGEFDIQLISWGPEKLISKATAAISDDNCDWVAGEWCNFEAEIPFPQGKGIGMLGFYQRDEQFGPKLIYKFPVYERSGRNLGTDNLTIAYPKRNQAVTTPISVIGMAKNIFAEGQFRVDLVVYDYPLGHPKYAESSRVISSSKALITGGCDWVAGEWCNFEAYIYYSPDDVGVEQMLYFYTGGAGAEGTPQQSKFIFALPINLK